MKRVIWTVLLAVVSGGAAALAARALSVLWRRVTHEDPPDQPRWARFLVAAPLRIGVRKTVQA